MVQKNQEKDLSTGPLAHPFAHTAHLFAFSALLARSAALIRLLSPLQLHTHSCAGEKWFLSRFIKL